jgi:hypothetical protein
MLVIHRASRAKIGTLSRNPGLPLFRNGDDHERQRVLPIIPGTRKQTDALIAG